MVLYQFIIVSLIFIFSYFFKISTDSEGFFNFVFTELCNKNINVINVESTRFDDVMAACVSEGIFTSDRVTEFKKGIRPSSEAEYRFGI